VRQISKYAACLTVVGLAACSSMGMGGNQSSSRTAAAPPAPQPVASDTIKQVQTTLQRDGYYKQGAVDGVWGSGTADAVMAFQKDHSLTPNGKLDLPTLQAMNLGTGTASANNAPPPPPYRPANNPPQNAPAVSSAPNGSTQPDTSAPQH
jgi:peptidoglycan hydrolase-like protein with peptidoglycan-binding domain